MRNSRAIARATLAGLLLLGVAGCFNPFAPRLAPTVGVYIPPPTPNSPQNVIRLFEWCWNNRDITLYSQIFTDDFQFVFALGDSAGNMFRDAPLYRSEELEIARHLFVGGGAQAPATSIVLRLDPTLRATADSRPGKNAKWHKEILTSVDLAIKTEDEQDYRVTGYARFFVVRGDSALIPEDMKAAGFGPDSTRWYIEQWNDETLSGAGGAAAVQPAGPGVARASRTVARSARPTAVSGPATAALEVPTPVYEMSWGKLNTVYLP